MLPATLGSAAGVYLAETLHNGQLGLVITAAVLVALLLLFTKLKEALVKDYHRAPRITGLGLFVLCFVGVWLGFIVLDGATYLLLVLIPQRSNAQISLITQIFLKRAYRLSVGFKGLRCQNARPGAR